MNTEKHEGTEMKFSDINLKTTPLEFSQALVFFPNGYGASVLKGLYSIGLHTEPNSYEVAVLRGTNVSYVAAFDTPISDGYIVSNNKEAVEKILQQIEELPAEATPRPCSRSDMNALGVL